MASKVFPKRLLDVLLFEVDRRWSRKVVTFRHAAGVTTTFYPGQVLEIITSKYNPVVTAGNAVAVLAEQLNDVPTATDVSALVIVRGAIVDGDELTHGLVAATVNAALEALPVPILVSTESTKQNSMAS